MELFLKILFGLSQKSFTFIRENSHKLHRQLIVFLYAYILALIPAYFLSIWVSRWFAPLFFFGFLAAIIGLPKINRNTNEEQEFSGAFQPDILAWVFGGGVIFEGVKGSKNFIKDYFRLVASIALNGSLPFFFLFMWADWFRNNPAAFPTLIACLILLRLMYYSWGFSDFLGRFLIYAYVTLAFIFTIISLIPSGIWTGITGYNVPGFFSSIHNPDQEALSELKSLEEKQKAQARAAFINQMKEKIKNGQSLTPEEQEKLKKYEEEIKKNSLLHKVTSKVRSLVPEYKWVPMRSLERKKAVKYYTALPPGEYKINGIPPFGIRLPSENKYIVINKGSYIFRINDEKEGIGNISYKKNQYFQIYRKEVVKHDPS